MIIDQTGVSVSCVKDVTGDAESSSLQGVGILSAQALEASQE